MFSFRFAAQLLPALIATSLLAGCAAQPIVTEPRDELGRQLYSAHHVMDTAMFDELRQKVSRLQPLDDQRMMQMMHAMGPNYAWYVSDSSTTGRVGVLILGHGFRDHGDRVLTERIKPLAEDKPTVLALGMSMMTSQHIQVALDDLAAAGAKEIVVIPAVSTRHNTMARQWDYIFGRQSDSEYVSVPRVSSKAKLRFVSPLEDHPLVGETLVEYAREISDSPANEEVIIVAHGPLDDADNQAQIEVLNNIARYIDERSDYAGFHVQTLQDDAPPAVRRANVVQLRKKVTDINARGRQALIVTSLLGTRTVQSSLRRDLRGLQYRFNPKGLMQHDNFIRWIEASVEAISTN